jgi:O-antigen/teichoic acid export membrane protein
MSGREEPGTVPATYRTASLPELYGSAFVATLLLAVAFAAATFPAALFYFSRTVPSAPAPGTLAPALGMFLLGAVLNMVAAIPSACLSGFGHVALDSLARTGASLVGFGLLVVLVPVYRTLDVLCAIYLVQGTVALGGSHFLLTRLRRETRMRAMRLGLPLVRSMYRESASIFVSRLGGWLTQESTLLIAGWVLGSPRIADFAFLRQVVAMGASVTTAIPMAISPHVAAAHSAGDGARVRGLYLAALRYSLVLGVLWTIGLLLWAPNVVGLLVGKEHFLGYSVLVPLAMGCLLELHATTHGFFVWNLGRWPFAPHVVAGGILSVTLASLGCAFFGFEGLAWGSMVAQAATMYWVQVAHALRQFAISFRVYLAETVAPLLGYGLALAISATAVKASMAQFLSSEAGTGGEARVANAAYVLAGICATTLLAAVLAWMLILTREDRTYFLRLARLRR